MNIQNNCLYILPSLDQLNELILENGSAGLVGMIGYLAVVGEQASDIIIIYIYSKDSININTISTLKS